jgi:hypothetical protein
VAKDVPAKLKVAGVVAVRRARARTAGQNERPSKIDDFVRFVDAAAPPSRHRDAEVLLMT